MSWHSGPWAVKLTGQRSVRPAGVSQNIRRCADYSLSEFRLCHIVCHIVCMSACLGPVSLSEGQTVAVYRSRRWIFGHTGGASNIRLSNDEKCKF